jgi:hypothetical protein
MAKRQHRRRPNGRAERQRRSERARRSMGAFQATLRDIYAPTVIAAMNQELLFVRLLEQERPGSQQVIPLHTERNLE